LNAFFSKKERKKKLKAAMLPTRIRKKKVHNFLTHETRRKKRVREGGKQNEANMCILFITI
jgi:hypothetical protein